MVNRKSVAQYVDGFADSTLRGENNLRVVADRLQEVVDLLRK